MDIDSEHLGIPDAEYQSIVRMPAAEFARICRDLSTIGDTGNHLNHFVSFRRHYSNMYRLTNNRFVSVLISVSKEGVQFSTRGDMGTANIVCRRNTTVDKVFNSIT